MKVYLAGPLFSDAERNFNIILTDHLQKIVKVYLPQRDGGLMEEMVRQGIPTEIAASSVFRKDLEAIKSCDYLIAILDGRSIDEGVAFEIGMAYSLGKFCVGLQTDSRRLASWGNNPMITGALNRLFLSIEDLIGWLRNDIDERKYVYNLS